MRRDIPRHFSVLMVCMGNICRSPTAEGVFRHMVRQAGLDHRIHVDSAGTHDYHVGSPPDERSTEHAALRGYDLSALRARQVTRRDFERFDLVLAMDWENLLRLQQECPPEYQHKLKRLMQFAPGELGDVVGDPYHGGDEGFQRVLNLVEAACQGLLKHVRSELRV
jgi:protein-tyrosine phosphatase